MDGHQFLADQEAAFAPEVLCFEKPLCELEEFLLLPSHVVEFSQLSQGILGPVRQGGDENGLLSIGQLDLDHAQADGMREGFSLLLEP